MSPNSCWIWVFSPHFAPWIMSWGHLGSCTHHCPASTPYLMLSLRFPLRKMERSWLEWVVEGQANVAAMLEFPHAPGLPGEGRSGIGHLFSLRGKSQSCLTLTHKCYVTHARQRFETGPLPFSICEWFSRLFHVKCCSEGGSLASWSVILVCKSYIM